MQSIKNYGFRRVREAIPRFILNNVFLKPDYGFAERYNVTLEAAMIAAVIDAGIVLDIQLIDGLESTINLEGLEPVSNLDGSTVVQIPFSRTGGKEIQEIYRVNFIPSEYNMGSIMYNNAGDVDRKVNAIYTASSSIPVTSTSECQLIAPNTLLIDIGGIIPTLMSANVNLCVSKNLEHIPPKAYELFGDMCVERTKQYIHNETVINTNRGFIDRGFELGEWKTIIDGWSESGKNYRDLLKRFRKQSFFYDKNKVSKYLTMITPSLM